MAWAMTCILNCSAMMCATIPQRHPTGGSSEEYWSMGESLNQPSSVQDDGPMGCPQEALRKIRELQETQKAQKVSVKVNY